MDATHNGGSDVFLAKLNPAAAGAAQLTYATYLGGSGEDAIPIHGLALDGADNAYLAGYTNSSNFPTVNAVQSVNGGSYDAFAAKLNAAGSALDYSTYLGGSGDDYSYSITVDLMGSAYVTGPTSSSDFPTANPFQGASGGGQDAFVVKLSEIAPTTFVSIEGGDLRIEDTAGADSNDLLTIQSDTANSRYVISDPNNTIGTSIPGATGNGTSSVSIPFSSVTGTQVFVNTLGGDDSLTVDLSLGNFSKSVHYDGGGETTGDSLTLSGGGVFATITHSLTSANSGAVVISGNEQFSYSGLEPVTDNLIAADRSFMFESGSETITMVDAVGARMTIDSTFGESISFANPTSNLTISAGTGHDTVTISSVDSDGPFDGALTINGEEGDDTINIDADIAFAPNNSLEVILLDDTVVTGIDVINVGTNANLTFLGTGQVNLQASRWIHMASGSSLSTVDGDVTLIANPAATGVPASGVTVAGATISTTGWGNVALVGSGGNAVGGNSIGVNVTGGLVTTAHGNISIHGTGGSTPSGGNSAGVLVDVGGIVAAGDNGTLDIVGIAGAGSSGNTGFIMGGGSTQVQTVDGDLTIIAALTSGPNSWGIADFGGDMRTTGVGNIRLISDTMNLAFGSVDAGANTVILRPANSTDLVGDDNGDAIDLGSTSHTAPNTLELSDAELDRITAGSLVIGNGSSGTLVVSADVVRSSGTNMRLISAGDVVLNGGQIHTAGGTLLLQPGVPPAAVRPIKAGTDVTVSTLSFASDLAIVINGATVDSDYTQLNVVGEVDLTGVDLVISGAHVPTTGQTFTIVNNDGVDPVVGTFNGLPEGATVTVNGVDLTLAYGGGTGNDVTLTLLSAPTTVEFSSSFAGDTESGGGNLPVLLVQGLVTTLEMVDVLIIGGLATSGSDFNHTTTVMIPAGNYDGTVASAVPISLSILEDNLVESLETIELLLANPSAGLAIDDANGDTAIQSTHSYEIADNDVATFTIDDVVVSEGDGLATFTLSLSNPLDIDVVIGVSYADVSTDSGDFDHLVGQATFLGHSIASQQVTVNITDDNDAEAAESFTASLSTATVLGGRAVITTDLGTGTITDNDVVILPPGELDPTFDADGVLTTSIGSGADIAYGVATQSDGKIVAVGTTWNGTDNDFAMVRYLEDGTLDSSFGNAGKVVTSIGPGNDQPQGVVIQNDGKIVVAGLAHNGVNYDFAVARYNIDGSLDTTSDSTPAGHWSSDGIQTTPIGAFDEMAHAVVIQSDQKVVLGGFTRSGPAGCRCENFALARYDVDGELDTTFDGDGIAITNVAHFGLEDSILALALQSDGKIVAGGYSFLNIFGAQIGMAVTRFNTNGSLDNTFGTGGQVLTTFRNLTDSTNEQLTGLAIQSDGKIVAVGPLVQNNFGRGEIALARFTTNGSLDGTFDGDGRVETFGLSYSDGCNAGNDQAYAVAVQPNGKIVVGGHGISGTPCGNVNYEFEVVRYNANGSRDNSFSGNGVALTSFTSGHDEIRALVIDPDTGTIVTAGYAATNGTDFALARYIGDTPSDDDLDGVSDDLEDGAPNGGDGNADGIPDRNQFNVSSLPNSANGSYLTLVSPPGTTLFDVAAVSNPSPTDSPAGVDFPLGFLEFTVKGLLPGGAATVELIVHGGSVASTYYKYGPTPGDPSDHWYEFLFDGGTGAEIFGNLIYLHFLDGQRGDDDLLANGEIFDPGGLGGSFPTPPVITTVLIPSTGCGGAAEQELVRVTVEFADPNLGDTHTAAIDWGDGTTELLELAIGDRNASFEHEYAQGGVYPIIVTVTDGDSGTDTKSITALIAGVGLHNGVLQIIGTNGPDDVTVKRTGGSRNGQYKVRASFLPDRHDEDDDDPDGRGGKRRFDVAEVTKILILLCDGDDHAKLAGNIDTLAIVDGGMGDDHLIGGSGPTALLGGEGDDKIVGGSGRNLIIGGWGSDRLIGSGGDDLMIAGATAFDIDDDLAGSFDAALEAILCEWNSNRNYAQRVSNIRGKGSGPRRNGEYFLQVGETVFDDLATDLLTGSAQQDWFFAELAQDRITDRKPNEQVN
jgi:uncharacterized delta-60 repeat protein